ncbi:bifunctional DNA primase/polymerase [Brasilonema sp. CT11]|nr:bifunctional DNA primase/polymerase [Brasilonema sp. CT11]
MSNTDVTTTTKTPVSSWKPFNPVPDAKYIASELEKIPSNWSLTPVQDKSPKRQNWQIEESIPRQGIAALILQGEKKVNRKGNAYTNYWSGYGIRTGEQSGGIIAIDVDGSSAQPLLDAMSSGDLPKTVSWTSGKDGRYQIAYQVPDELRSQLKDFNRVALTEWGDLQTARDEEGKPTELLEFRYNGVQSVLPPSRHPSTGNYSWINSPESTEVAIAPQWLCDLLVKLAEGDRLKKKDQKQKAIDYSEIEKLTKYPDGKVTDRVDFLYFEVLPKLSVDQIYNGDHKFQNCGNTLKGRPTWRESTSGTSFHVWNDGKEWAWTDKGTGEGGGAIQYRHKMRGGTGTPRGKAFIEIVNELAFDAGVPVPEFQKNERKQVKLDPRNPEAIHKAVCEEMDLPFENCVTQTTYDCWVYDQVFGSGENWRVIDSAFYQWSPEFKYWKLQPDSLIYTLIAESGKDAFKLTYSKMFGWIYSRPYETSYHTESAFKHVQKRLERTEPLPANAHLLSFLNCVVDLRTGTQMPHDKKHFLTNMIPHEYSPGKECPEDFRVYIIESFGEDQLENIRVFTSMFLDPTAPYGRFPHLIGQSGGGKGTLGRFWGNLFGQEGSGSAAQFNDISTPEGRHQYLTGKRTFGLPDVGGFVGGVRAFYELVDNGSMSGRALFNKVAYSKQWYVRFWVASVDHLQIENAGDGWGRRAFPIPVKNRSVKPDPDLWRKLEACKADVISWALAMPREDRDRILLSPPTSDRAINLALDAALYSDSTKSFVDLCLRPSATNEQISNHQLHDWYTAYCKQHGYTPLGMSKFINHLRTVLPQNHKDRSQTRVNGKRVWVPAHWNCLIPLSQVFVSRSDETSVPVDSFGMSQEERAKNTNLIWTCLKRNCQDGGLSEFLEFWQPETTESLHSKGAQGAQGSFHFSNCPVHPETLTQQGCTDCTSAQGRDLHMRDENHELRISKDSDSSLTIYIGGENEGGDGGDTCAPAPDKDSSLHRVLEEKTECPVQAVQPVTEPVSEISTPQYKLGMRVRVVCPGSQRDGMLGSVNYVSPTSIRVWLDDSSLGKLREFECLVPGTDLQRVEIL